MLSFIIEPDGEMWHAYCPELKGCHTFGATREEAMHYLKDAVNLYIEDEIEYQNMAHISKPEITYA